MSGTIIQVLINGIESSVTFNEDNLTYSKEYEEATLAYEDIIGFEKPHYEHEWDEVDETKKLYYIIQADSNNKLQKDFITITAKRNDFLLFNDLLKDKIKTVVGRPKSAVVFLNPISGSANSESIYWNEIDSIFKIADISTNVIVSEKPNHFKELAQSFDFSAYDVLVVMGGDGTLSIIINALLIRKMLEIGKDLNDPTIKLETIDIPIATIPSGSGNAKAWTAYGCLDILTATLHILKGRTKVYPVLANFCEEKHVAYSVLVTAQGLWSDMMQIADSNRWLRKLRYIFVPLWFYLFKEIRRYDAEVQLECLKVEKDDRDENVTEQKTVTLALSHAMAVKDEVNFFLDVSFDDLPSGKFFPFLLYEPRPRIEVIKRFLFDRFLSQRQRTKADVEAQGNASIYPVKSVTIKVLHSQSDMDLSINIDGETYRLPSPEITVRLMKNAFKIYTSFEKDGRASKQN